MGDRVKLLTAFAGIGFFAGIIANLLWTSGMLVAFFELFKNLQILGIVVSGIVGAFITLIFVVIYASLTR